MVSIDTLAVYPRFVVNYDLAITNRNYNFIYIEIDTLDTYIMNLKINDQN